MLTSDQYGQLLAAIATITRQCHSPQDLLTTAESQLAQLVGQAVEVRVSPQERGGPVVRCSATSALDAQGQELLELFTVHFRCLLVQAQYCERLVTEALRDPLTGLLNRRAFERDLNGALNGAVPSTLVILDIRQFKRINDTFGHVMGDRVLQAVALALTACVPGGAQVYRLAGDEFALLGALNVPELAAFAAILRVHLSGVLRPYRCGALTLDLGAAVRERGESAGEWLHRADQAMYADKRRAGCPDVQAQAGNAPLL